MFCDRWCIFLLICLSNLLPIEIIFSRSIFPICHANFLHSQKIFWKNLNSTNRKYTSQPVIGVYSLIVNQIFYILKNDFGKIWIPPIENILPSHWYLPVITVYSLMVTRIFFHSQKWFCKHSENFEFHQ